MFTAPTASVGCESVKSSVNSYRVTIRKTFTSSSQRILLRGDITVIGMLFLIRNRIGIVGLGLL
jgi:hypothetical protein